ncbi:Flp family type IVb pilin [Neobacillus kokaensis]|uniref:Flp family type IVb pilin n=1 Tax=Neobacillus kokaensis TaxID=2759023 RepID=A0ABQ3MY16_9BACI|nr:Flp family type IVb pilin [Neobacillus kokaensis]GHH97574.1 hypothetical protein AM1BK_11170 [Neobacillus kokaensis]
MLKKLKDLVVKEEGQALTEYGLIIALIAVVVIGALTAIGTGLDGKFEEIKNAITGAGGGGDATE